ncbi:transposase domain containing protein [Nephila pilipes]|uniref:Transposase domain containing protein n=1 Tax=Nephila pilipes TaxID=299642 RepID=A0A8X6PVK0_NEPPI|nr:transposase domain containing protein [Nephila pilipes]
MGRQLRVQRPPIRNISDLPDHCLNIWYNLSPFIFHGLVAFMPRRDEAVLRAKDGPTRYSQVVIMFWLLSVYSKDFPLSYKLQISYNFLLNG